MGGYLGCWWVWVCCPGLSSFGFISGRRTGRHVFAILLFQYVSVVYEIHKSAWSLKYSTSQPGDISDRASGKIGYKN